MYLTFKNLNTNITNTNYEITDPMLYLLSGGKEGITVTNAPNLTVKQEFITAKVDKLSMNYVSKVQTYITPLFENLKLNINLFLKTHPDFLEHKENYYTKFSIPKKKKDEHGNIKWRHLINPHPELKTLQKLIADTLQKGAFILPHNAAHAFREGRDYYTNAKAHQNNNHIINLDLQDFFDSITEDIVHHSLMLHPAFNVSAEGQELADLITKIATFEGTTPQGSPLSPYLSNIVMVAFDYELRQKLNSNPIATIYTRYADDMTFSSKKSQDIKVIIHLVEETLQELFGNHIKLNYKKTKKITPGRCFITGVKLNKLHDLTVGWEKKKLTKSRIYNLHKKITNPYTEEEYYILLEEAQSVMGYLAFMYNIEPGYTNYLHKKYKTEITMINVFINNTF